MTEETYDFPGLGRFTRREVVEALAARLCGAPGPDGRTCTLDRGHEGDHVAHWYHRFDDGTKAELPQHVRWEP